MKFALLGLDEDALELARAITESTDHSLDWLCDYTNAESRLVESLRSLASGAKIAEHYETLCEPGLVDAVIVARGDDEARADALRRLVQQKIPVLVVHPVVDSMLVYYELDMIRQETDCPMMPYLPNRWHPLAIHVAAWMELGEQSELGRTEQSELGRIEQLVMERHLADRSKPAVLRQFARDVDLIRSLCGEVNRIGAMGAASEELAYGTLSVQMTGPRDIPIRWSIAPINDRAVARLNVIGSQGRAVLVMPDQGEWELQGASRGALPSVANWSAGAEAVDRFARAVGGQAESPNWIDAARSIELAESIERSLRKGRTLELHFEDYTEEGTFKGTMTSLGCGLLVGGLILMVVIALLDQLGVPFLSKWPVLLVALMGLFLIMQLITLSFGNDKRSRGKNAPATVIDED